MFITDKNINTEAVRYSPEQVRFIVSKNERLSSALYMVTNLMPDSEPLKWKLRELSLSLLSEINNSFGTEFQIGSFVTDKIMSTITNILSYISVALSDANVSQMNFTILKQEYESLKNMISAGSNTEVFASYVLSGVKVSSNILPAGDFAKELATAVPDHTDYHPSTMVNKVTPKPTIDIPKKVNQSLAETGDKGGRKESIKQFLKGREWTSIKDISRAIPSCSVKTVQRDLVDLVNLHVLEKVGERRWSRYRIIG